MKPVENPNLSLAELNLVVAGIQKSNQSAKDRAIKQVNERLDALTAEVQELQALVKEMLAEEVVYVRE